MPQTYPVSGPKRRKKVLNHNGPLIAVKASITEVRAGLTDFVGANVFNKAVVVFLLRPRFEEKIKTIVGVLGTDNRHKKLVDALNEFLAVLAKIKYKEGASVNDLNVFVRVDGLAVHSIDTLRTISDRAYQMSFVRMIEAALNKCGVITKSEAVIEQIDLL